MILKILTLFLICFCGAPITSISSVKSDIPSVKSDIPSVKSDIPSVKSDTSSIKSEDLKPNIESPIVVQSNAIVKADTSVKLNTQSKIDMIIQSTAVGKSENLKTVGESSPITPLASNNTSEDSIKIPIDPLPLPLPPNTSPSVVVTKPLTPTIDFPWESDLQKALGEQTCNDSSSVPPKKQCYTLIKYCMSCHNWTSNMSELTKKKDDIILRLTNTGTARQMKQIISPAPPTYDVYISIFNSMLKSYQEYYAKYNIAVTPNYNTLILTLSSTNGSTLSGSTSIDLSSLRNKSPDYESVYTLPAPSPMPKNRWQTFYDSPEGKDLIKWLEGLPK